MTKREDKRSAAQGAADTLRHRILSGAVRPGRSLPGERELSEELGVSRLTLRNALATLEAEGLVRAVHGSGTRVLDYREHGGVDLLGHLAREALAAPGRGGIVLLSNLLELRRAVAIDAIALATERATPEQIRAMRDHVEMQAKLMADPHAFMVADLAFARLVVRATRNLAYELLFNTVARTIEGHPGVELAFHTNAEATLTVYRRLLDRMESRDARRAGATAARLLHRLDKSTLETLERVVAFMEGGASAPELPPTEDATKRAKPKTTSVKPKTKTTTRRKR